MTTTTTTSISSTDIKEGMTIKGEDGRFDKVEWVRDLRGVHHEHTNMIVVRLENFGVQFFEPTAQATQLVIR